MFPSALSEKERGDSALVLETDQLATPQDPDSGMLAKPKSQSIFVSAICLPSDAVPTGD